MFINGAQRADTTGDVITVNAWNYVAFTYNSALGGTQEVKIFVNGVQVGTGDYSTAIGTDANEVTISDNTQPGADGYFDEVRISNIDRSADWLLQDYQMIANQSTLVSVGAEESLSTSSNFTTGFIKSVEINLTDVLWENFTAEYALNDGNITFSILASNGTTLCSGLGDISSCAHHITPIVLYAELSRTDAFGTSPSIDNWVLSAYQNKTIREVKGAGEINVGGWASSIENSSQIANAVWSYEGTIANNILSQIASFIWSFSTRTLTDLGVSVNTTQIANDVWNATSRYTHGVELT